MSRSRVRAVIARPLPPNFSLPADERVDVVELHADEELIDALRDAEVLYAQQIPSTIPAEAPALRWIQLASAGADHLRALPIWSSDIQITSARGLYAQPVAEHALALLLALTRRVPAMVRAQQEHGWIHNAFDHELQATELRGKTLGIVGWGKIGDNVAHLARAFGMRIVGTRASLTAPEAMSRAETSELIDPPWLEPLGLEPDMAYPATQLEEVLRQSDAVVLVLPLTRETANSFGEREFRVMKPGALFVNVGRGPVVREEDLVDALRGTQLGGAALDVFAQEPLPATSPLWTMPNVLISPHVGGVSDRMVERTARLFALNLARYLDGEALFNVVDRNREY